MQPLIAAGFAVLVFAAGAEAAEDRDVGQLSARAAVVMDGRTGELLFARNPHLPLPPASTTKVLTALVALENGELDRDVPVSHNAATMEPSKIWLRAGWRMNFEDMLYAVLLNSANDASVVVAEAVAGSVPRFAGLMNATARSVGARQSNFVNPNGLPNEQHYSTAFDLAQIMRHAMQDPRLREILSTRTRVIQPAGGSARHITLRSHNRFLDRKDVPVLGKTGYTRKARRCFVGVADDEDRELVVALLGSERLWTDLDRLVEYGRSGSGPPANDLAHPQAWVEAAARPEPRAEKMPAPSTRREAKAPARSAASRPRAAKPERSVPVASRASSAERRPAREKRLRYHVQLASFRNRSQAQDLIRKVTARGYRAAVEPSMRGGRVWYRVTVRGFESPALAQRAARSLQSGLRLAPVVFATRA